MKLKQAMMMMAPLVIAGSSALAQQVPVSQILLGTPTYNGTGCPLGTVSATLSPDAQSLSILFGSFEADAGGSTGKTLDRKACDIAIPVSVPGGFSVSVIKIDYRGYNRLPINASATFDVEYFFAGQNGPAYHKSFVGATDGNFTLDNSLIATSNVWSPCGEDVNLRTNTSVAVQTNQYNEQAMFTLDSADITSGVVYQLQWRQCNPYNPQPTPTPYNPYPPHNPQPTPTPYNPYPPYNPQPTPTPYNPYPPYNPQPTPPPYNPYPPYNPQPTPTLPPLAPCIIDGYNDQRGFTTYMVKDGTGRVLGNTVQYAQAISMAQQAQQMGFCSGIVNNAPNPNYPNPYPAPPVPTPAPPYNPYPPVQPGRQSYCEVRPGRDASGRNFYRVLDRSGRIVLTTPDYNAATSFAQTNNACFQ